MDFKDFQTYDGDLSDAALEQYLQGDAIAVDTETMGLVTPRDRLCLVQLCDAQGYGCVIRIAQGQAEAPNLKTLMESPGVVKVFHFARFDLAALRYYLHIIVNPVFCTKVASKLARTYSPRHGLKDLVLEFEQVELDKTSQSSDWGNVNALSENQLRYAANDVIYLTRARLKLIEMLKREDRWELAQRCFDAIPTFVELDLLQYPNVFEH